MNFSCHPVLPAAPDFSAADQEVSNYVPLAGCPQKIHPKSIPGVIKREQFFALRGGVHEVPGDRPSDNGVCRSDIGIAVQDHKMLYRCPPEPGLHTFPALKSFGIIAVLCYCVFKPIKRSG